MHREAKRFNVVCCGRRFGKTLFGVDRLLRPAINGGPVAYFSPTYKMMAEVWRDVRRVALPATAAVDKQQHRIELITGGTIEMWSLDTPNTARGRKYQRVVVDEAAMVPDLEDAWQAVLRPTLADYRGDAWMLSTPKGRNFFWQMWNWGQGGNLPEWMSWQMPTSANPYIAADEIEAMRLTMPERTFAQEVLAQFIEDGNGVFRRVRAAATATPQERIAGHQYVIGADWAQLSDFTVFSVIDITTRQQVALDRFNQIDYGVQRGRLWALWERYGKPPVIAESNSIGLPIIEQLSRDGMSVTPFVTTNATKAQVVDGLALAFEQGTLAILNDPVQLAELEAFEAERLPSGLLRYRAPQGSHDDTVMALCLAWYGASQPPAAGVSDDPDPPDWQRNRRPSLFGRR